MVERGAWEFEETEKFIETAEQLISPYCWQRYDLLLLPPSFPYGGMENPCLTFVTPTIVAGDRSLVDVVAHEISHSWAGNLVTNKNWQHFWLNEGFCVFIERKIVGRLYGEKEKHLHAINGWKSLEESVKLFGSDNPLTALVVDLNGVDPDDAFSSVPYEKGFNLINHIETVLGGPEVFEPYLKAHYAKFERQSVRFICSFLSSKLCRLLRMIGNRFCTRTFAKIIPIEWLHWTRSTGKLGFISLACLQSKCHSI
jgi:leukotriene-A4 hydrolase